MSREQGVGSSNEAAYAMKYADANEGVGAVEGISFGVLGLVLALMGLVNIFKI